MAPRRPRVLALIAVASAAPSLAIPVTGLAAAGSSPKMWVASYTNSYGTNSDVNAGVLNSVVAISKTKALASGFTWPESGAPSSPVVKIWNGHRWRTWAHQPPPWSPNHTHELLQLAASSMSNVWQIQNSKVRRWNGSSWHTITNRGLPYQWGGRLVVKGSRTWVVGADATNYGPPYDNGAFAARYRHGRWVTTKLSRQGGLLSGYARTSKDVWAVGETSLTDTTSSPLIAHYDGRRWHATVLPHVAGRLEAVAAVGPHSAMAVGGHLVLLWNGHKWRRLPRPAGASSIDAVAPAPAGGFWMTGQTPADHTHTVYYRYHAGVWTTEVGPQRVLSNDPAQLNVVTAMATYKHTVWSVGYIARNDASCDDDYGCPDHVSGVLIVDRH